MAEWMEFAREKSALSSLQIGILSEITPCLPFLKDLTGGDISVYAPKKDKSGYIKILGEEKNGLSESPLKSALIEDSFRTGKAFNQWEESDYGGSGIRSFPIKDGKKNTIAVVIVSYKLTLPMADFTHLLHAVDACLSFGRKFDAKIWKPLTREDGVMIADKLHRIVFADEVARHIYRSMGIINLLGRNIFDEDLKQAVTRETYSKKSPWEREMMADDRILRERRLDFAEGGECQGHLVILTDITAEKKREQDEKVQAALLERISELEDELTEIKDSLAARKLIDRAKGYLMDTHGLTEEESYRRIQKYAMTKRMTIKEVAEAIIRQSKK